MTALNANMRPTPDGELVDIADYVHDFAITNRKAIDAARLCTTDTLACALDALAYPECTKLLGYVRTHCSARVCGHARDMTVINRAMRQKRSGTGLRHE